MLTVLDGRRLATVEAINSQIQEIKDKPVELRLLRGGKEQSLRIAPRKSQAAALSDKPVTVWETTNCKQCHKSAHEQADPHSLMGWKLGVDSSVWTDGNHAKLFLYDKAFQLQLPTVQKPAAQAGQPGRPEEQIDALKAQLAELQRTLVALESTLRQPAAGRGEKSDQQRD